MSEKGTFKGRLLEDEDKKCKHVNVKLNEDSSVARCQECGKIVKGKELNVALAEIAFLQDIEETELKSVIKDLRLKLKNKDLDLLGKDKEINQLKAIIIKLTKEKYGEESA